MRRGFLTRGRRASRDGSRLLVALGALTCSVGSGCAAREDGEALQQTRAPVVGGVPSGEERDAVVLMLSNGPDRSSLCTATLIAPNLAVTVRHCVSVYQEGTFSCTIQGNLDLTRPRIPSNAGEVGPVYAPELVSFHVGSTPSFDEPTTVGKQVFALETDTICRNDIAFVVLQDSVDAPIAPIRLTRGTFPGESTMVVGYGINESRMNVRYERSDVEVLHVGSSAYFPAEGNALPRTFVVGPSACHGDSGGPALSEADGAVLGVSSLSRGDCDSREVRNFFTQLAPYEDLARQAFDAAGHKPLLDESQGNQGDGGAGSAEPGAAGQSAGGARSSGGAGGQSGGCTWSGSFGVASLSVPASLLCLLCLFVAGRLVGRRRSPPHM